MIIRLHVAAFANSDGAYPMCERQSPLLILSRISASRVARSGMRSSASARHISATPSWLDSKNSWDQAFDAAARAFRTQRFDEPSRELFGFRGDIRRQPRLTDEERHALRLRRRYAAVIAARSTDCGCTFCAKSRNGIGAPSSSWSSGADSPTSDEPFTPVSSGRSCPCSMRSRYAKIACLMSQCGVRSTRAAASLSRERKRSSILTPRVVLAMFPSYAGRAYPARDQQVGESYPAVIMQPRILLRLHHDKTLM